MPEPVAPHPEPATTLLHPSPNGTAPPMPADVTNAHKRPVADGMMRRAMAPFRKMMRRTPRQP